jgi:hypothetical protein
VVKEIRIPEDLWLFVGRELLTMGYINEDVLISATVEEPRMRWLLLEKEEWQNYLSLIDLRSTNPIEHANQTEQELTEYGNSHNLFIKETLKRFPETESFLRETELIEFDNVIVMSAEKTEKTFREADESQLRYFGKAFYHSVDSCRLTFFIHELIHIYEFRLGKPIIEDTINTESILQNKILLRYLSAHSLYPNDFKLSYIQETDFHS